MAYDDGYRYSDVADALAGDDIIGCGVISTYCRENGTLHAEIRTTAGYTAETFEAACIALAVELLNHSYLKRGPEKDNLLHTAAVLIILAGGYP